MTTSRETRQEDDKPTPPWSADTPAMHADYGTGTDGKRHLALVRHPTHPYTGVIPAEGQEHPPHALFRLAEDYLLRLSRLATADQPLREACDALQRPESPFAWLGLMQTEASEPDGRLSFVLHRDGQAGQTWVLLAGNQHRDARGQQFSYGGRIGLRVVAHVGPASGGWRPVRITSASFSALDLAWTAPGEPVCIEGQVYDPRQGGISIEVFIAPLLRALQFDALSIDGLSVLPLSRALCLSGTAVADQETDDHEGKGQQKLRRIYAWGVHIPLRRDARAGMLVCDEINVVTDYRFELASHLITAFGGDPASSPPAAPMQKRAPTRNRRDLDQLRTTPPQLPANAPDPVDLAWTYPPNAASRWLEVRETRLRRPQHVATQAVPNTAHTTLPLRSDDLAAAHAWQRGAELFQRITAYGLQPTQLFRLAGLPLVMRHHDRQRDANDGRTVNAQVMLTDKALQADEPYARALLPLLEVVFGAASLSHWNIERNSGQTRPEPLGLAADARWAWHEFGHVLCFGSTGDIELPFAHSAGDALAAIVSDPDSTLQADPARHLTFPWVRTGRRHDRDALLGWCWCGRRNTRREAGARRRPMGFTGYFAEQLLSTSLFRAYEIIGGAPGSPADQRRRASDYLVYLLMQATALLGPANTVPATTADDFVSALIDADVGTQGWTVNRTWGPAPKAVTREGGTAHKAIRWAFEQQGLYAVDKPADTAEGPGKPPEVDVYIAGQRGRAKGGYAPLPLDWHDTARQPWHASTFALGWKDDQVTVRVRNRGRKASGPVEVTVWVSDPGGLAWTPAASATLPNVPAGRPGLAVTVTVAKRPRPGAVVLAAASGPADRANGDPAAGLPCAFPLVLGLPVPPTDVERLLDLVANDNNMGLRVM